VDVAAWLHGLGLQRYEQAFRDNEIDARVLPRLTAEDLKDLGVTLVGHRRRLLDAIAALDVAAPAAAVTTAPRDAPAPAEAERRQHVWLVFLLYQKGRNSRIFQAQDRLGQSTAANPYLYSEDTWHGFFARLRRDDPVHFCDSPLYGPHWSVTRYRDIMTVDTSHQTYSSDAAFGGIIAIPGRCRSTRSTSQLRLGLEVDSVPHRGDDIKPWPSASRQWLGTGGNRRI
jgi:hypothetical protein